jgi:sterol desaturase/sphingolipid hydroxylase (fatty acid hydroxylase superfamily)
MREPYKSLRLFENPFLEWFSHVHPITPLLLWSPVVGFLLWRSIVVHQLDPYTMGVLGVAAVFLWTLTEYALHRFLFHFEGDSPAAKRAHFLVHGMHHDDPQDPTRLVMPPAVSVTLSIIVYSLFRFLMGEIWAEPFFAFFVIGYLCYDYIHFGVHHFTPKSRVGKYLKQSHMMHHYVSSHIRWGVSSPFWDYIFGTMEESKDREQIV